jgi:hypothetical protein
VFLTSVFSDRGRRAVCEHAYQNTRDDLARRAGELAPILRRHGLRLRREALSGPRELRLGRPPPSGLRASAGELRDTLGHLRSWMAQAE